jgi:hypothetical protein
VDQFAGSAPLVPARRLPSRTDQLAGERIAVGEMRDLMPRQDRSDGACWDAQLGIDPVWSTSLLPPDVQHLRFDLGWGEGR